MNQNRVNNILNKISELLIVDTPTSEEYFIIIANMLFAIARENLSLDDNYTNLDIENYNEVEMAYMYNSENAWLAAVMQAHIILKWSNYFIEQ